MRLVEEYIRTLLREEIAWDRAEQEAKEAFEAALAELNAWDEAKQAYDAAHNAWEQAVREWANGDRKTRGKKPKEPTMGQWPILRRKRDKLQAVVEKTKQTYSLYDPAYGMKRDRPTAGPVAAVEEPPEDVTIFGDFNRVRPVHWYSWPTEIIETSMIPYKPKGMGVGPGEEWFAYVFGGRVQGGSVSFDVVLPDGQRWELKAVDSPSASFMTGTKGLQSTAYARGQLARLMKQMNIFRNIVLEFNIDTVLDDDPIMAEMVDHVITFVEDEYENIITKGELPGFRVRDLRRACMIINRMLKRRKQVHDARGDAYPVVPVVGLDDEEYTVSQSTFISVAHKVQKDLEKNNPDAQVDVLNRYEELDVALSVFNHKAFDSPRQYWSDYFRMIRVEDVFQGVEGVIIINRNGFMKVPRGLLKDVLVMKGLTMGGKPQYGIRKNVYGSGPLGAPPVPLMGEEQASAKPRPRVPEETPEGAR